MHGTPVEVRKGPRSTTWYDAFVLDVQGKTITVGFEGHVWLPREVPACAVRRAPDDGGLAQDEEAFDPQPEEVVEVLLQATETSPSGWSVGRVKTAKNGFFFIGFLSPQRGLQDVIVERDALRPCSRELPLEPEGLVRRLMPVGEELRSWISSQDSLGCFGHVQKCTGLLVARCTEDPVAEGADGSSASGGEGSAGAVPKKAAKAKAAAAAAKAKAKAKSGEKGEGGEAEFEPEVLLVGEAHDVEVAERLLEKIHFKNQLEMQRFHELRERFVERLIEMQEYYSTLHREVFEVEQHLVGKVIGKRGENIKQVRERNGVEIQVRDGPEEGAATSVTVTGDSADAVRRAREELEFVTDRMPLEPEQVGWILGKGYQNISEIARKTELAHARFHDKDNSLELCGLKHQVDDARMLIRAHTEYLSVYKNMDEEQNAIQQSFEQLDSITGGASRRSAAARRSKGEGGSRAVEAGKPSADAAVAGGGQGGGGGRGAGRGSGRKGGGREEPEER